MFVNLEDKSAILEFDTKTLAVKGTWPLRRAKGLPRWPYDSAHHRLFAACDKMMAVVDADTGKVVARPPIGGDPDGDGFDPGTGMIFASCREGLLSVIHEDSPDKYSVVGNVTTQFGTRTMTLDPKTHHVFTVTADFKAARARRRRTIRVRARSRSRLVRDLGARAAVTAVRQARLCRATVYAGAPTEPRLLRAGIVTPMFVTQNPLAPSTAA